MAGGVVVERHEGTPQGGPLSPLLANVLLDEVDRELERRGHTFARYADDLNVYVRSTRAGERVMQLLRKLYGRLRLRINEEKSAIAPAKERKFLGFSFWWHTDGARLRVAPKALEAFKDRVRKLTFRSRGRSLTAVVADLQRYLTGWRNYFGLAQTPAVFRKLDHWIRRRLRAYQLHLWRHGRVVYRELVKRGAAALWSALTAKYVRSWWDVSTSRAISVALPNDYFDSIGLPRLAV
jgi:RNA-directed DNA polymerase